MIGLRAVSTRLQAPARAETFQNAVEAAKPKITYARLMDLIIAGSEMTKFEDAARRDAEAQRMLAAAGAYKPSDPDAEELQEEDFIPAYTYTFYEKNKQLFFSAHARYGAVAMREIYSVDYDESGKYRLKLASDSALKNAHGFFRKEFFTRID